MARAASPPETVKSPQERLVRAQRAYETGNYRQVRALCASLVSSHDEAVAAEARALIRRTEVDPVQVAVLVACLVLTGVIAYVYVLL